MPVKAKEEAAPAARFAGFPKAGMKFLRDLKKNNDREWFRERKPLYEESVHVPMELVAREVAAGCRKRGFALYAKEKNPVMRVYRDIRFSPDKRPFKTHVGCGLKHEQSKSSQGEVYIHISPEESFFAAGFWMPERSFLQAWREAMASDRKKFQKALAALEKSGLALSRESTLTRLPRGFDAQAGSPLADIFKLTSYVVTRPVTAIEYTSPRLVGSAVDFALAAKPLLEYGWSLNHAAKRDILELDR